MMSQTGRQGTIAPELPSLVNGVGAEEENQVCSLMWCPGQIVTRLNTYYGDDHHCCLQRGYIGVCLHLSGQAVSKLHWPWALPLLGT